MIPKLQPRPKHCPWDGRLRLGPFTYFGQDQWSVIEREVMRRAESRYYVREELERLQCASRRP